MISPTLPSLSLWQRFYGALHRLRWRWYERHAGSLPRPVVSVGNIHWGGTGKTPLVARLAGFFRDRGQAVAVLSRGYRRVSHGSLLVSRGQGLLVPVEDAGDEPSWLAESLPGVAVAVGESRLQAGLLALSELDPDLFLLDDGFSHLALRRDLDLVVLPGDDPLGGGLLPPGGRLREPLAALSRAHAVLLSSSGDQQGAPQGRSGTAGHLAESGFDGPIFSMARKPLAPRWPDLSRVAPGTPVLLVSGVGRPDGVEKSARASDLEILDHLVFPDHHRYPQRSIRAIEKRAMSTGAAALLTTGKDRIKLQGRTDVPLAELPLSVEPEETFWTWLQEKLEDDAP